MEIPNQEVKSWRPENQTHRFKMAQLYHWPVPCTICESPVEYHCNTCGDVLCIKCRDNHLKSNATRHHDVVPYSLRTEPSKPSLRCGEHPGHPCGLWCRTCNKAVCTECVTSPNHEGHRFLKLDAKIVERRKEIQKQFEKYSRLLSEWQMSLHDTQKLKETCEKDMKKLDKEIVDRADELCKQVRKKERESRKQLQEMKDVSLRGLQDHQKTLADGIHRLKEKVKEVEDTLRSKGSSTILQYSVVEENIPGTKPSIDELPPVPVFIPGSLNIQDLKDMFGSLSEKRVPSIKSVPVQSKEMLSLLGNFSVESVLSIEQGHYTPAIACVGSGQAWVQTADSKLQLIDRKDNVKTTVHIDFSIGDMAVTPKGNILLPDQSNKRIRSMSMEGKIKIKTLFNTQWEPWGICCLPSGDIVVTFRYDKKVVHYSSTGKIIREFESSLYPWYVAHNQVNQQLYVCEKQYFASSMYDSGRILVFHMNGHLQYTYTVSYGEVFRPGGVCTDLAGHVLITDPNNYRVHILDKAGKLIQYLDGYHGSPLTRPETIDVDSEGYVWIGEMDTGKLKLVKYKN